MIIVVTIEIIGRNSGCIRIDHGRSSCCNDIGHGDGIFAVTI